MKLCITVVDPVTGGDAVDCTLDLDPGSVLGDIRHDLLAVLGRARGELFCGPTSLPDDTVVGRHPLLHGSVLTLDGPVHRERPGVLELHVTSGPDAGSVHRLAPGEHSIGRACSASVCVADADVSRLHARLRLRADGAVIDDLGSTNGTSVDGEPVAHGGSRLAPGAVLGLGATRMKLVVPEMVPVSCHPDGGGYLELNRRPRLLPAESPFVVTMPDRPVPREAPRFPTIALAVPLVAGLALVAMTGASTYLLLLLLSPLMVLGNFTADRVNGRRQAGSAQQRYDEALRTAQAQIDDAVRVQTRIAEHRHPAAPILLTHAQGPHPRLWERRPSDPDHLLLRVGLGELPSTVRLRTPAGGDAGGPDRADPQPLAQPLLVDVPVAVSLATLGVLGAAGPRAQVLACARFWIAQLAGWHSPQHVGLVLVVADESKAADWTWARWLPHLHPTAGEDADLLVGLDDAQTDCRLEELSALLDARSQESRDAIGMSAARRTVVVILDGAGDLRRRTAVSRLLAEGPRLGVQVICLGSEVVDLPAECRGTVEAVGAGATQLRLSIDGDGVHEGIVGDGVSAVWAQRFARALAPLRDATPELVGAALPARARLLDLLARDVTVADELSAAWRESPRGTRVTLGVAADGRPFVLDLQADGPHVLIAGTTGSGKSELLQTLVAGLAVANRPDQLSFVLIDYKGGAAFEDCARLPHTVGLVTDLDGHLTERALKSLRAELRRRETVLRLAGAKDLDAHAAGSGESGGARLPRLVLVVDEFATLAEELPDFIGGLVGIAQRGRSLGVHLVLATQRPAGVVSADIRANTGVRIALRVADPAESVDVVDTKAAAAIARTTPGRAVIRLGAGPVASFQTARIGGLADMTRRRQVHPRPWISVGASRLDAGGGSGPRENAASRPGGGRSAARSGSTDLELLVAAAQQAAAELGVKPAASPWLPPLPEHLSLADVEATQGWSTPLGVSDLPDEQRRTPWALDLAAGGHLMVAGTMRSGRSTVLRTLAGSLAHRFEADDVHLYALDPSGVLAALVELPHCGAVVARDQVERADRLLARLGEEVDRRRAALAAGGYASLAELRHACAPDTRPPWLVLLVDDWDAVQTMLESHDHGRPLDALTRLAREGVAAGLRIVVTGQRGVLTSRLGSAITDRLVLRMAEPADYGLAGIPARRVPPLLPTGRGLLAPDAVETHVALLDPDPAGPAQVAAITRIAAAARTRNGDPPRHRPIRVEALPHRIAAEDVSIEAKAVATGALWALVGVGGDELGPLGVDLAADGPAFVVAGPPRSGRSTTLATMCAWLGHQGTATVLVASARSPLRAMIGSPGVLDCLGADDGDALRDLLERPGPVVVLADDAERLHETAIEAPLVELVRGSRGVTAVVLAGSSGEMGLLFRGLTVEARRGRCGLLLGSVGPADGDLLGVRVRATDRQPSGRGLLVRPGGEQWVQVATTGRPEDRRSGWIGP